MAAYLKKCRSGESRDYVMQYNSCLSCGNRGFRRSYSSRGTNAVLAREVPCRVIKERFFTITNPV